MKFTPLHLEGAYLVELNILTDNRGSFARTFCKEEFRKIGHTKEFVQANQSWNTTKGTVRGMHFQIPPFKEVKLIRCIKGRVFDVIVDIRKESPTFLQHFSVELSEENKNMIYVPEGFAHGFYVMSEFAEFVYKCTDYYHPQSEVSLLWDDPEINIDWPLVNRVPPKLSAKDLNGLSLDQAPKFG